MPEAGFGPRLHARLAGGLRIAPFAGLAIITCTALAVSVIRPPRAPTFIWNASGSMPMGLYAVDRGARIFPGDTVAARLAPGAENLAAVRQYLPHGLPVIKYAAGVPGDRVCSQGERVTVNGRFAASRKAVDAKGRALPSWQGCLSLSRRSYFLLGRDARSFDGRYFGPSGEDARIVKARLIWRR